MAITSWPRFSRLESPSGAAGKVTGSTMRISARSVSGSSPTSRAVRCWPSGVVTSMRAEELAVLPAPATWLLVRISPSGATTTPEPVPPRGRPLASPAWIGEPDHRRADPVDHVDDGTRIGVEERLVLDRNFGLCSGGSAAAAPGGIVQGYDFHVLSGG